MYTVYKDIVSEDMLFSEYGATSSIYSASYAKLQKDWLEEHYYAKFGRDTVREHK